MEPKKERTIDIDDILDAILDDMLRELDPNLKKVARVLVLAPIILTGRQLHLMHHGKARVRKKWWNEARRRLEKSGL